MFRNCFELHKAFISRPFFILGVTITLLTKIDKKIYSTDLTDKQREVREKLVDGKARKPKYSLQSILDEIFYIVKTGCQWRMLTSNFAPSNTVYYYYRKWKHNGLIGEMHEMLRDLPT
ncbi:transposase [Porphyromonas pogonae]|uniref:transposase n=1 Tax=Porphyromonas pogonae TaxID=867595 RepID=UPI0038B4C36A